MNHELVQIVDRTWVPLLHKYGFSFAGHVETDFGEHLFYTNGAYKIRFSLDDGDRMIDPGLSFGRHDAPNDTKYWHQVLWDTKLGDDWLHLYNFETELTDEEAIKLMMQDIDDPDSFSFVSPETWFSREKDRFVSLKPRIEEYFLNQKMIKSIKSRTLTN